MRRTIPPAPTSATSVLWIQLCKIFVFSAPCGRLVRFIVLMPARPYRRTKNEGNYLLLCVTIIAFVVERCRVDVQVELSGATIALLGVVGNENKTIFILHNNRWTSWTSWMGSHLNGRNCLHRARSNTACRVPPPPASAGTTIARIDEAVAKFPN